MKLWNALRLGLPMLLALALAGCGGGGSSHVNQVSGGTGTVVITNEGITSLAAREGVSTPNDSQVTLTLANTDGQSAQSYPLTLSGTTQTYTETNIPVGTYAVTVSPTPITFAGATYSVATSVGSLTVTRNNTSSVTVTYTAGGASTGVLAITSDALSGTPKSGDDTSIELCLTNTVGLPVDTCYPVDLSSTTAVTRETVAAGTYTVTPARSIIVYGGQPYDVSVAPTTVTITAGNITDTTLSYTPNTSPMGHVEIIDDGADNALARALTASSTRVTVTLSNSDNSETYKLPLSSSQEDYTEIIPVGTYNIVATPKSILFGGVTYTVSTSESTVTITASGTPQFNVIYTPHESTTGVLAITSDALPGTHQSGDDTSVDLCINPSGNTQENQCYPITLGSTTQTTTEIVTEGFYTATATPTTIVYGGKQYSVSVTPTTPLHIVAGDTDHVVLSYTLIPTGTVNITNNGISSLTTRLLGADSTDVTVTLSNDDNTESYTLPLSATTAEYAETFVPVGTYNVSVTPKSVLFGGATYAVATSVTTLIVSANQTSSFTVTYTGGAPSTGILAITSPGLSGTPHSGDDSSIGLCVTNLSSPHTETCDSVTLSGTTQTTHEILADGTYTVAPSKTTITYGGQVYDVTVTPTTIRILSGDTTTVTLSYTAHTSPTGSIEIINDGVGSSLSHALLKADNTYVTVTLSNDANSEAYKLPLSGTTIDYPEHAVPVGTYAITVAPTDVVFNGVTYSVTASPESISVVANETSTPITITYTASAPTTGVLSITNDGRNLLGTPEPGDTSSLQFCWTNQSGSAGDGCATLNIAASVVITTEQLPAGTYTLAAHPASITYGGQQYAVTLSVSSVTVTANDTSNVTIRYQVHVIPTATLNIVNDSNTGLSGAWQTGDTGSITLCLIPTSSTDSVSTSNCYPLSLQGTLPKTYTEVVALGTYQITLSLTSITYGGASYTATTAPSSITLTADNTPTDPAVIDVSYTSGSSGDILNWAASTSGESADQNWSDDSVSNLWASS